MEGYSISNIQWEETKVNALLTRNTMDAFHKYVPSIDTLRFTASFETPERIKILISDASADRWRVPDSVLKRPVGNPSHSNWDYKTDALYSFEINDNNSPGFFIRRKKFNGPSVHKNNQNILYNDDDIIFGTYFKDLIFKDQFLKFNSILSRESPNLYGFGENISSFRKTSDETTITLFTRGISL